MATANPDTVNSNIIPKMKNVMLWISDVLKIGGEKKTICIMGTVVNILYSPYNLEGAPITKPNIYEIDDGTGVLRVVHWPNNFNKTHSSALKNPGKKCNKFVKSPIFTKKKSAKKCNLTRPQRLKSTYFEIFSNGVTMKEG